MDKFLKTSLGRFRLIAFTEGLSYLFLLFVAMPLKYLAAMPLVVKYAGWVHGLLFVLFMLALLEVTIKRNWNFFKYLWGFFASLIPLDTFFFDRELKTTTGN